MYKVKDVYNAVNRYAPFKQAQNGDNVGLLIGDDTKKVTGILVSLDVTIDVLEEAKEKNINLIVCHHPVIYGGIAEVTPKKTPVIYKALDLGISIISAHTNLDVATDGVNYELFKKLELKNMKTLKQADNDEKLSIGLVGDLDTETDALDFVKFIKEKLKIKVVRYVDGEKDIKKVAICGGSGMSLIDDVIKSGADAFVCGDIRHHDFLDAYNRGFTLIDAGHFYTENIIVPVIASFLKKEFDNIVIEQAETGNDKVKYYFK